MKLSDGLHSLDWEQYSALNRANFSRLKLLGESPAHYRHSQLNKEDKDKDAYRIGRCTHLAAYEPEIFRERCVVWDLGTRRGRDWEEFKQRNEGREILTAKEYELCLAIGQAARNSPMSAPYMSGGRGEVTVLWSYGSKSIGGLAGYEIPCKSRVDFLQTGAIVDLKTCQSAKPEEFGRATWNYRYHVQASFYREAVRAVTGKLLPYKIVAVEKTAPHVVQVFTVPDELLELGRETWRGWMDLLFHCRSESEWPGYSKTELDLTLPRWAAPQEDEDAAGLGLVIEE